jgi:hypothetical protein
MMLSLNWGLSKARVWLDELPAWQYQGSEIVERHANVATSNQAGSASGAIELFRPIGARFYYGALALTFTAASTPTESLTIQVPILDSQNRLQDALTKELDTVFVGLLEEYTEGIFAAFQDTTLTQLLGPGTLRVAGAAHGVIGSSSWVFQVLGRSLVKLLMLEQKDISDERAVNIIQKELKETSMKRS